MMTDRKPLPNQLRRFDVVRAWVRYEDDKGRGKYRPIAVIRISNDGEEGVGIKVTSNPTWTEEGDIHIEDWAEAGLDHLSTARCAQLVRFETARLDGYYGHLSRNDIERLSQVITSLPPERFVWL
ncbi:type II toxin-antitoxin system PemK/MazF family toxin [Bifidobacterium eulemuris]|uniref:Uncharacterized protein n=2 Tax=Bifidobacterium eulemuris TaxID=1765219 RepID=A0A261GD29_9BIFI|nr:type II toxin-antitoxin system PemK/MazF family toxin [Bifidobacterium eulemuris]OZG69314.1 hypothetical protein BEUL_0720 [Bifidobacterium eulemuris]